MSLLCRLVGVLDVNSDNAQFVQQTCPTLTLVLLTSLLKSRFVLFSFIFDGFLFRKRIFIQIITVILALFPECFYPVAVQFESLQRGTVGAGVVYQIS